MMLSGEPARLACVVVWTPAAQVFLLLAWKHGALGGSGPRRVCISFVWGAAATLFRFRFVVRISTGRMFLPSNKERRIRTVIDP